MAYSLNLNSPDLWQTNSDAAITSTSTKIDNGTIVAGPTSGSRLTSKKPVLATIRKPNHKYIEQGPSSYTINYGVPGSTLEKGLFITGGNSEIASEPSVETFEAVDIFFNFSLPKGTKSAKLYIQYSYTNNPTDISFIGSYASGSETITLLYNGAKNTLHEINLNERFISSEGNVVLRLDLVMDSASFTITIDKLYILPDPAVEREDVIFGVDTPVGDSLPPKSKATGSIRTTKTATAVHNGYNINDGTFDVAPTTVNVTTNLTDKENQTNSNGRGLTGRMTYAMPAAPKNESHDQPT